MSPVAILRVAFQQPGALGGYLRYIQHRPQPKPADNVHSLVSYVAYRDGAARQGRLFNGRGEAGDRERRALEAFVKRSLAGVQPRAKAPIRAAYDIIISPADHRGLDLKKVTRKVVEQLQADAGGIGPWIAAEHRNTAHWHVHLVLAGRRQVAPGVYREVRITKPRLQRMKDAMLTEIERQRPERRLQAPALAQPPIPEPAPAAPRPDPPVQTVGEATPSRHTFKAAALGWRRPARPGRAGLRRHRTATLGALLQALATTARDQRRELERQEREAARQPEWVLER